MPFKVNKKTIRLISGLIVAGLALVFGYFQKQTPVLQKEKEPVYQEGKSYKVTKVFDGDTLELEGGARVRLIGIDTPEDYPNEKAARDSMRTGIDVGTIVKMGKEAKALTESLVDGKNVVLAFDAEKKDKYGRLLAYVWYEYPEEKTPLSYMTTRIFKDADGKDKWFAFLNGLIVGKGYAQPMTIPPNVKYADLFQELYQEARENKRGLWKE